jgi:quinol monooxygenase YgiN
MTSSRAIQKAAAPACERVSRDRHIFAVSCGGSAGAELDPLPRVLIACLSFDVRPDKRGEFLSAVMQVVHTIRWSEGCLGCRLVGDCEYPTLFTLFTEWDSRLYLDRHLASAEFQILEGTRYLLHVGPFLTIDEVVSRGRFPSPVRHFE